MKDLSREEQSLYDKYIAKYVKEFNGVKYVVEGEIDGKVKDIPEIKSIFKKTNIRVLLGDPQVEENVGLVMDFNNDTFNEMVRTDKNKAIVYAMSIVDSIANGIVKKTRNVEYDDLVSVGYEELIRIVNSYVPELKDFKSYAYGGLRRKMLGYVYKNDSRGIEVSASLRKKVRLVYKAIECYEKEHGRKPSTKELALELKWKLVDLEDVLKAADALREYVPEEDVVIGGLDSVQAKMAELEDMKKQIETIISRTRPKMQAVIRALYGLDDGHPKTDAQVSKLLKLPIDYVKSARVTIKRQVYYHKGNVDGWKDVFNEDVNRVVSPSDMRGEQSEMDYQGYDEVPFDSPLYDTDYKLGK